MLCTICKLNEVKKVDTCKKCKRVLWKIENKESIRQSALLYRENNKEKIKEKSKIYRENNKDNIILKSKEYYENNKEVIKVKSDNYRILNTDKEKERKKKYYNINKEEYIKNCNYRIKVKIENDPKYRLIVNIRSSIRKSLYNKNYNKNSKTSKILGCTFEEFISYLESKFEDWMNWENRGLYNGELNYGWDIDHIIPLSSVNSEEDIIKLNHYTNLQPLCSYVNRCVKKDSLDYKKIN